MLNNNNYMINQNFCLIKKNKLYGEIYDVLEDEELSMHNPDHTTKIQYQIDKITNNYLKIEISSIYTSTKSIAEDALCAITANNNNLNIQGNTLLINGDTNTMYEILYMEDLTSNAVFNLDDMNEFGAISNIELVPIYNDCAIFKTNYSDGILKGAPITSSDISNIIFNNFYHTGTMINTDGTMNEIIFSGDNPSRLIGNNYTQGTANNILGLSIVPYYENLIEGCTLDVNHKASELFKTNINGRVFVAVLCPVTGKKTWSINSESITDIISILRNSDKVQKIDDEIDDGNRLVNPFYLIKKYK